MSALRRRRGLASKVSQRLVVGMLLGELLGAIAGVFMGARRHAADDVGTPLTDQALGHSARPAVRRSDASDDDLADPLVIWPLLGLAAGAILGWVAAAGTTRWSDSLRGPGRCSPRTPGSEATGQ